MCRHDVQREREIPRRFVLTYVEEYHVDNQEDHDQEIHPDTVVEKMDKRFESPRLHTDHIASIRKIVSLLD